MTFNYLNEGKLAEYPCGGCQAWSKAWDWFGHDAQKKWPDWETSSRRGSWVQIPSPA